MMMVMVLLMNGKKTTKVLGYQCFKAADGIKVWTCRACVFISTLIFCSSHIVEAGVSFVYRAIDLTRKKCWRT